MNLRRSRSALRDRLRAYGSYEKAARAIAIAGVDVSGSYLSLLVRGERDPSVQKARDLARVLDIDLLDVIGSP